MKPLAFLLPLVSASILLGAPRTTGSPNVEIQAAYLEDQADRAAQPIDVPKALQDDARHRRVVHLALDHHLLASADDYFHAGMIMQHGAVPPDFALARDLAKRAMALDPSNAEARWLYAAATDRYLQNSGSPQIYGTQYRMVNGRWTLEPFDSKAISDEERKRCGVQSLAERLRFIDQLNAQQQQTEH